MSANTSPLHGHYMDSNSCDINTEAVWRTPTLWINASFNTNSTQILAVHQHCPFDYCDPTSTDWTSAPHTSSVPTADQAFCVEGVTEDSVSLWALPSVNSVLTDTSPSCWCFHWQVLLGGCSDLSESHSMGTITTHHICQYCLGHSSGICEKNLFCTNSLIVCLV